MEPAATSLRVRPAEPTAASPTLATLPAKRWGKVEALLGLGYMLVSIASGFWYVLELSETFANDMWWAGYNLSGHEAFIVDVANQLLHPGLPEGATLDLLSASMVKQYASPVSSSLMYPTYARQLVLHELQSLEYAVRNLRTLSPAWSLRMNTQHCYVDFAKAFEIAHTEARQARCAAKYSTNAAVYLEATLRNQVWSNFLGFWAGPGKAFSIGLLGPLQATRAGQEWLATTAAALPTHSVAAEVAYWTSFGVQRFEMLWQDKTETGITESFTIWNALGMPHTFAIKSAAAAAGPWSSENLYWQPLNDLWAMWTFNRSLIASSPNWFGLNRTRNNLALINGNSRADGTFDPVPQLFNDAIGPFVTVDILYVAPPVALRSVFDAVQAVVANAITSTRAIKAQYDAVRAAAVVLTPQPPAWTAESTRLYYGGNPGCTRNAGTAYVQETIGFFDACNSGAPLAVSLDDPNGLLFALQFYAPAASDACALSSGRRAECLQLLSAATTLATAVGAGVPTADALNAVQAVGPELMQFSFRGVHGELLRQPLLDTTSPAWSFYGSVMLYDWVLGRREVLQVEGDVTTMVLLSAALAPKVVPTSSGNRYIERATVVLVYLIAATSAILALVALLCLWYASLGIVGRNLAFFNRVAGATWVGRPLLFLRGAAAACLLSSTRLALLADNGVTRLALSPRGFLASAIVAAEATWVTYVVQDVMVIVHAPVTARVGPMVSCALWLAFLLLDQVAPLSPIGTVARVCDSTNMDYAVACSSASVALGSAPRFFALLGVQVALPLLAFGVGLRWLPRPSTASTKSLLLSGAALTFLAPLPESTDAVAVLDDVSCVLTGVLPFRRRLFDMPLWVILPNVLPTSRGVALETPLLDGSKRTASTLGSSLRKPTSTTAAVAWLSALGGFGYILASIAGSVSYAQVSATNLANDVFWATFNSTGTHALLANWFNEQLVLGVASDDVALQRVALPAYYGAATALVSAPVNFGAKLQHAQLSSVVAAIEGLRATDACHAPWIFTPYCYVDVARRWELAHSQARQARCATQVGNGAVFLELLLRNIDATAWRACWGDAFEIAIGRALSTTIDGVALLSKLASPTKASVRDEVVYWTSAQISSYDVQWQNYKRVGVLNSYVVVNAYGVAYPLTLQAQTGSFRLAQQTSHKMYWGLGHDLGAVAYNASGIGGQSLVRGSSNYAFANASTLQSVMVANGTLAAPLPEAFAILTTTALGPFGTIDMTYVSVPSALAAFIADLLAQVRSTVAESAAAEALYFNITPIVTSYPLPLAWLERTPIGYGGSPLCPGAARTAGSKLKGPRQFFSFDAACSSGAPTSGLLQPTRDAYVFMATMARLPSLDAVCANDAFNIGSCVGAYPRTLAAFLSASKYDVAASTVAALAAQIAAMDIRAMVWASLTPTSPIELWHINLVNSSDSTYSFFGWNYIFDWALGQREVVAFVGDVGRLNLISELQAPLAQDVLPWEVSTNIARYFRAGVLYVTFVMIVLAGIAGGYIVAARGHIQGLNMLELARVGGHVWIGRPFLFLRSLTALTLLSTSTVTLGFSGRVSSLSIVTMPWYKTLLAASEVTWLVAVVNDIMIVFTRAYTATYATFNSVAVWVTAAALSFAAPVAPTTRLGLDCSLLQVDLQVVCRGGTIEIGQVERLGVLVGIVLGWNVICFCGTRLVLFRSRKPRYLFEHSGRTCNSIYFLDRASAAITGLLTLRYRGRMYALDFKLWRFVALRMPSIPDTEVHAGSWRSAVPLQD
ncbi:hypothetical protein SPRG_12011 [Saprolegnia parasitica CBS 223.65]|uniref:Uncharacterized protein n=1 Tax=Saprolegnia parasitica (strain CBS 223.65) TaxID=695850 RepID=A0A067BWG8_SAPPC|nr:hypothetical protein SPRG_12011 [Saprolegnia parasitica CBS 223.65]KDO22874.1 hypothetical protein SPRG_12011 [Saprolegnia parasitica CBS 223.65]|eukprot:XP_012206430.1 hypothetical protein SPRG_12011 [Saprolegnia parasitica CBS 223.65]